MSLAQDKLFKELLNSFLKVNSQLEAVIVSDHEGFVIAGEKKKSVDLELISVLTTLINPILERIRNEFAFRRFGTASFDTDDYRLLFISIDENTTLSVVLNNLGSIDIISPYAYFLAEKVAQVLTLSEGDLIQLTFPNFEVESEKGTSSLRIKEQIYQMRLDSGGKYRFKFVIVGDHMVGKTSIVRRFVENKFSEDYRATIGLNILTHTIEFYGNEIHFSLWDVGAQEYFKRFRKTYYQGAQAAFIVYDLTNKDSFINIEKWFSELKNFIGEKQVPIVIVGNKLDLEKERVVDYQLALKKIEELSEKTLKGGLSYIETSALTGDNVEDAFSLISYHYITKSKEKEEQSLNSEIMEQLNLILKKNKTLTISFITENALWSPGFQILNEVNDLCECERTKDNKEERIYEYSNGLVIKNFLYDDFNVSDSDCVFIIFDGRDKTEIVSQWREIVLNIIAQLEVNKIALIGIRISEEANWSKFMDDLDINQYLEKKLVSVLFFKLGSEYRLEIYDQLQIMLTSILNN